MRRQVWVVEIWNERMKRWSTWTTHVRRWQAVVAIREERIWGLKTKFRITKYEAVR